MFRKNKEKVSLVNRLDLEKINKISKSHNIVNKIRLFNNLMKCDDYEIKDYIDNVCYNEELSYTILSNTLMYNGFAENEFLAKKVFKNRKRIGKNIDMNKKVLSIVFKIKKRFNKEMEYEYNKGIDDIYNFMEEEKLSIFERALRFEFSTEQAKEINKMYNKADEIINNKTRCVIDDLKNNLDNVNENIRLLLTISKDLTVEGDHYYFYSRFIKTLCDEFRYNTRDLFIIVNTLVKQLAS